MYTFLVRLIFTVKTNDSFCWGQHYINTFCPLGAGLLALRGRSGRPPRVRPLSHDPLRQLPHPDGSLSLQAAAHSQQLPRHLSGRLRPRRRRLPARRPLLGAHLTARPALQSLRPALLLRHLRLQRFRQYHLFFIYYYRLSRCVDVDTPVGSHKETVLNRFAHLTQDYLLFTVYHSLTATV